MVRTWKIRVTGGPHIGQAVKHEGPLPLENISLPLDTQAEPVEKGKTFEVSHYQLKEFVKILEDGYKKTYLYVPAGERPYV